MPKQSDPAWELYTKPTSKEQERGGVPVTIIGWICNFCGSSFFNRDLNRFLGHVSCNAELCVTGAAICSASKVPSDVRRTVSAKLELAAASKQGKAKRKQTDDCVIDEEASNRAAKVPVQSKMRHKTEEVCAANGAVADFFDGYGVPHNKIDHALTKAMFAKVKNAPRDWKPPSASTLGGNMLDAQHQVNVDERTRSLEHAGVEKFGLTATTDGATIQKCSLMNFIIMCVVWPKAFFPKCVDCTSYLATDASKDAEYITGLMIAAIRALPRPRCLDLIITDGAGDMTKFRTLIVAIFPWLYTLWCVSHIANCVLKKASSDSKVDELIKKGKKIVDRFGGSKHFKHSIFVTKSEGRALIRYTDTRFGLYLIMLHRLLLLRTVLLGVVTCPEYVNKKYEDDEEFDIITDSNFWDDVTLLVKVVWPLMMFTRLGDARDRPTLHLLYKSVLLAEERLLEYEYDEDAGDYAALFLEAFQEYNYELCSPLAMAASLVDVASWANGTLKNESECRTMMSDYLANFAGQYEKGPDFLLKAEEELATYMKKEGLFSLETVQANALSMSPRRFFDKYASSIPCFAEAALHLASKVCGSGEAERNWKEIKPIYDKRRSRMSALKREKLIARYNVLAMRHGYISNDEVDASKEIAKYGFDEECVDPKAVACRSGFEFFSTAVSVMLA